MFTAPVKAMFDILLKKMPENSLFIGDSIYQQRLEAGEKDHMTLLEEYDLKERKNETKEKREERLKRVAENNYKHYKVTEKLGLLKSNPPRITRVEEKRKITELTFQKPDGATLVKFDRSNPAYQWVFTSAYYTNGLTDPYVLIDLEKLAKSMPLE